MMMKFSRRHFMFGLGASTLPLLSPRISFAGSLDTSDSSNRSCLVCIFQRGGSDGLNIIVPHADDDYYQHRPTLAVPRPDEAGGSLDLDGFFGLHPNMASLLPLYQSGYLAAIHATGSPHETHSHFDAMDYMERGYLDKDDYFNGWLGRHLSLTGSNGSPFQAVGMGLATQKSLIGASSATALNDIASFDIIARNGDPEALAESLAELYDGDSLLDNQAQNVFMATDQLSLANPLQYQAENGAEYPNSGFGQTMFQVAQLLMFLA